MARHRQSARSRAGESSQDARRARAAQRVWWPALASLPWVTVVLVALVTVLGVVLAGPDTYASTATITNTTDHVGQRAAVALTALDLEPRVEQEMELDQRRRGEVRLSVDRIPQEHLILVSARANDPRLAALAADTAAALVISQFPGELDLSMAAPVPTAAEGRLSGWWIGAAAVSLTVALLTERRHRRWEQLATQPGAPTQVAA
ncbi:MAG: hypothetical protein Q4P07_03270 [Ornithinimicrobium sp.]|uniref:hypothetical protein n=1 Tax=Ornithinimicrobium sp. TaxID=1977084 RepID=UPI0026DF4F65|nr:hypothetical protein [Ornithinimicrobium sp.]MDO5739150.1 hypothetical protein [Ornithinimicrobium sp.]